MDSADWDAIGGGGGVVALGSVEEVVEQEERLRIAPRGHDKDMRAILQRGVLVHELVVENSRGGVGGPRECADILTVDGECDVHKRSGVEEGVGKDVEHIHCGSVEVRRHRCGGESGGVRRVMPSLVVNLAEVECRGRDLARGAVLSWGTGVPCPTIGFVIQNRLCGEVTVVDGDVH